MAIIKSFAELGEVFHIKPKQYNKKNGKGKNSKKKARICKVCGSELRPIIGTNAWVCDGMKTVKDKETGENIKVPCDSRILSRRTNEEVPA